MWFLSSYLVPGGAGGEISWNSVAPPHTVIRTSRPGGSDQPGQQEGGEELGGGAYREGEGNDDGQEVVLLSHEPRTDVSTHLQAPSDQVETDGDDIPVLLIRLS